MPRKSAEIERWVQRIDADLKEDFTFYPSEIPLWYVDNVLSRVIAHLVGYTEDEKAIRLRATREGLLKVSTYPAIFEDYATVTGTALDDYDAKTTYELPTSYNRWDILVEGGDAVISFKKTNGTWGDDIILPEGFHSFEFSAIGIRIKNRVAETSVNYQITYFR